MHGTCLGGKRNIQAAFNNRSFTVNSEVPNTTVVNMKTVRTIIQTFNHSNHVMVLVVQCFCMQYNTQHSFALNYD